MFSILTKGLDYKIINWNDKNSFFEGMPLLTEGWVLQTSSKTVEECEVYLRNLMFIVSLDNDFFVFGCFLDSQYEKLVNITGFKDVIFTGPASSSKIPLLSMDLQKKKRLVV